MMPNESLLQVLHFSDYRTLVCAKLAATRFLHVVAKFADELARLRSFHVNFHTAHIAYEDMSTGEHPKGIDYEPGDETSLVDACRELDEVIGPHVVSELMFCSNTWNMPGGDVIFEASPALKYTEDVRLYSQHGSTIGSNSEAFMHNFGGMKQLRLSLYYDVFRHFSWTFLRNESARELRLIQACVMPTYSTEPMDRSVEELVRYCVTLPPRLGGEPLELDFCANDFSAAFGKRIIELFENSGRELTFRMRTVREGELILDERDYTVVDVNGATTRYACEKTGIAVDVRGRLIVIKKTAEVPRKKPRTTEEVLPVMPLIE